MILFLLFISAIIFAGYIYSSRTKLYNKQFREYKVYIDDLTPLWSPHLVRYLLKSIKNYKTTKHISNADILIYSILNNIYDKNKINIVISGESHILNNKVDLSICSNLIQNSKYNIYYPQLYSSLFEHRKSINNKDYITKKTKFCAYMYGTSHEHREKLFNLISIYKRVDSHGENLKNMTTQSTRHINNEKETYNDIAVDLYKEYKFVISAENKDIDGYNTEKLINPLIANSIPIYWGNNNIFKYINKKRLIYVPDYTDQGLIDIIKLIDNDDAYYNRIINEKWFVDESKNPTNIENNIKKEIEEKIKLIL